jgi:hypothetical protein
VRIFVSYRHGDSDYLAFTLYQRLPELLPGTSVLVDANAIVPGSDFPTTIDHSVLEADVVLVLVGRHWLPGRLREETDWVRRELSLAKAASRRVIPITHSGGTMPDTGDLPPGMEWFGATQSLEFASPFRLVDDLSTLIVELTGRIGADQELHALARDLHRADKLEALTTHVQAVWDEFGDAPSNASAECYRRLAVALLRDGHYAERCVWLARAISAANRSASSNSLAMTMLPWFYQCVESGATEQGRDILAEISRVAQLEDDFQIPTGASIKQEVASGTALMLMIEKRFSEAADGFELAARIPGGEPGRKARYLGERLLCLAHLGRLDESVNGTFQLAAEFHAQGWLHLAHVARTNAARLDAWRARPGTPPPEFMHYEVI